MQTTTGKIKILFLCVGNSCRSQMAEGWARKLKGDLIEPYSAGLKVMGLNPRAVRVMAEAGVDISAQRSKHVDDLKDLALDYVLSVCEAECPVFPGRTKVLHVMFPDPVGLAKNAHTEQEALSHYRRVRDQIKAYIETLPESLPAI